MRDRDGGTPSTGERVRRLTRLPREVVNLSEEMTALRGDVAGLRQDVLDLGRRLPGGDGGGAPEGGAAAAAATPPALEEEPFDDGIELFAERMAVLEDGLDDVAQRLEGMVRDGMNLVTAKLEQLTQRVDALAERPSLTQEQLEEALERMGNLGRSSSR